MRFASARPAALASDAAYSFVLPCARHRGVCRINSKNNNHNKRSLLRSHALPLPLAEQLRLSERRISEKSESV